jgi:hypothetical protein
MAQQLRIRSARVGIHRLAQHAEEIFVAMGQPAADRLAEKPRQPGDEPRRDREIREHGAAYHAAGADTTTPRADRFRHRADAKSRRDPAVPQPDAVLEHSRLGLASRIILTAWPECPRAIDRRGGDVDCLPASR